MDSLKSSLAAKVSLGAVAATAAGGFLFSRKRDSVSYSSVSAVTQQEYDFIVVGAGIGGCVTARRLAEHPSHPRVLLVEAGPPDNPLSLAQTVPCLVQNNQRTDIDWQNHTVPQSHGCTRMTNRQGRWPSGKVMGGSSILNYMMFVRGHREDFNSWAEKHGCEGWDWSKVRPLFEKLENVRPLPNPFSNDDKPSCEGRGREGPLSIEQHSPVLNTSVAFIKACQSQGFDFNADYNGRIGRNEGVGLTQYSTKQGARHSAFRAYIAPLFGFFGNPKNGIRIDVLPNSMVSRVLFKDCSEGNSETLTAIGVEIQNGGITYQIHCDYQNGGEVVICAGAVYSPCILMRSGLGPSDHLRSVDIPVMRDIPGVGSNLQDHVMQWQRVTVPPEMTILNDSSVMSVKSLMEWCMFGTGLWSTSGLDAQLFTHSKAKSKHGLNEMMKYPDLQLVCMMVGCSNDAKLTGENLTEYFNIQPWTENGGKLKNGMSPDEAAHSVLITSMLLHPQSRGAVRLVSKSIGDKPLINPNYLSDPYDIDAITEGMRTLLNIMENSEDFNPKDPSTGKVIHRCRPVLRQKDDFDLNTQEGLIDAAKRESYTIYHPAGTCKMGDIDSDEMAVCNPRLRVRGCTNLRVCDASVMPHLVSGNTQAACFMIGEKNATMMLEDWQMKHPTAVRSKL